MASRIHLTCPQKTYLVLPETTSWKELLIEYRKYLFLRRALGTNQLGPAFDSLTWPRLKRSWSRRKAHSRPKHNYAAKSAKNIPSGGLEE